MNTPSQQQTQVNNPPPTVKRKVVVTKSLLKQIVALAKNKRVSSRGFDKTATTAQCRDRYWKQFPHFMERAGKALWKYGMGLSTKGESDYAKWLEGLNDATLDACIAGVQKWLEDDAKKNQPQPPPPQPQPQAASTPSGQCQGQGQGQVSTQAEPEAFNPGNGGGGLTQVELDDSPPDGFQSFSNNFSVLLSSTKVPVDISGKHQLMARVKQAIMAVSQCKVKRDCEDGDLDMERLVDIGRGINLSGLYTQTAMGRSLHVACQIYIDISGSMCNEAGIGCESKKNLVWKLCHALGSVLETIGVPFQLIQYSTDRYIFKDFRIRFGNSMFQHSEPLSMGGTCLARALQCGFPLLANRNEPRKIAFVLADEDVGRIEVYESGRQKFIPSTVPVRKQFPQIETMGFGIGDIPFNKDAFDYSITGLKNDLVEVVSQQVARVIASPEKRMLRAA